MMDDQKAQKVIEKYNLDEKAEIVCELKATHRAFRVRAGNKLYALRKFNPYMDAEDLRVQFLFATLMQHAGLNTNIPILTKDGETFVEVKGELWALFPWCDWRCGNDDCMDDLLVLSSIQGLWINCCEKLRSHSLWDAIVCNAQKFRQRKSWAWVIPLDQVPRFVEECKIIQKAESEVSDSPYRERFLNLLPQVYSGICKFDRILKEQEIHTLPHMVTHGDFHPSNVFVSNKKEVAVFDLDCYSFEPRITDFARAANWYYNKRSGLEKARLFKKFQMHAHLSEEEIEALPLMMCAHDLYYAVGHIILFPGEPEDNQYRLIKSIQRELKAPERYQRMHDDILHAYLKNA
ncbi:MAG: phosphotransferase [Candidatus Edwardsbacteria bacterium]